MTHSHHFLEALSASTPVATQYVQRVEDGGPATAQDLGELDFQPTASPNVVSDSAAMKKACSGQL